MYKVSDHKKLTTIHTGMTHNCKSFKKNNVIKSLFSHNEISESRNIEMQVSIHSIKRKMYEFLVVQIIAVVFVEI
jgi:hypothetical protein